MWDGLIRSARLCVKPLPDGDPAAMNLPHPARSMGYSGHCKKQDAIVMGVIHRF